MNDKPPSNADKKTVYIDGREMIAEEDLYPLPEGAEILPDGTVIIKE